MQAGFNELPNWAKVAIGGGVTAATFLYANGYWSKRSRPITKQFIKDKIYLYQFPRALVLPSLSPYSIKLETWFRMANLDYVNVDMPSEIYTLRSKEGTLPFVELDGVEYDDSDFIIRDMTRIKDKQSMTAHLDASELGILRAVDKLVENSAFLAYGYFRYTQHFDTLFGPKVCDFSRLPAFQRLMFQLSRPFMKMGISKAFKAMPIGKHPENEIVNLGTADLRALSDILGDSPYFCGQKPTSTDACVFSLVASMLYVPIDLELVTYLKNECKNLVDHCERVKAEFWPDWESVTRGQMANSTAWQKN